MTGVPRENEARLIQEFRFSGQESAFLPIALGLHSQIAFLKADGPVESSRLMFFYTNSQKGKDSLIGPTS